MTMVRMLALFAVAMYCSVCVEAFRPLHSRVSNNLGLPSLPSTSGGRLLPLNTNPRKIDVGEESIARFGKVSTSAVLRSELKKTLQFILSISITNIYDIFIHP